MGKDVWMTTLPRRWESGIERLGNKSISVSCGWDPTRIRKNVTSILSNLQPKNILPQNHSFCRICNSRNIFRFATKKHFQIYNADTKTTIRIKPARIHTRDTRGIISLRDKLRKICADQMNILLPQKIMKSEGWILKPMNEQYVSLILCSSAESGGITKVQGRERNDAYIQYLTIRMANQLNWNTWNGCFLGVIGSPVPWIGILEMVAFCPWLDRLCPWLDRLCLLPDIVQRFREHTRGWFSDAGYHPIIMWFVCRQLGTWWSHRQT